MVKEQRFKVGGKGQLDHVASFGSLPSALLEKNDSAFLNYKNHKSRAYLDCLPAAKHDSLLLNRKSSAAEDPSSLQHFEVRNSSIKQISPRPRAKEPASSDTKSDLSLFVQRLSQKRDSSGENADIPKNTANKRENDSHKRQIVRRALLLKRELN